ncbi:hypothetical protein BD289DRAFT_427846 [Coniella lustricola]|uniref:LPXTG-motif cell wall anchor domain protein n=1 Tax=Coniella lustricola TaxID=2025994 RepID=A0A2T3AER1_9PEZI|nr:hypothetical protein BD289DRAFT_427846 [Coniella lustricola]
MSGSSYRLYDDGADYRDTHHRDRSLRALEGRSDNDWSRNVVPPDVDDEVTESENNTADIFMTIAREDSSSALPRPKPQGRGEEEPHSTASRAARRTRPASGHYAASAQRPPTPPASSRRLSDHQAPSTRTRRAPEAPVERDQYQESSNQSSGLGCTSSKVDSTTRASARLPTLKPSPMTPRTQSVLDNTTDRNAIFARRPSTKTAEHSRSSSVRQPTGLSKSFTSSSTLTLKNGDPVQPMNLRQAEASESSASTAAASTVWDELDELKSRIHRLELTGKLPKTSGAAISRTSDERPPTADTGATTLSGSPKRIPGAGAAQMDIISLSSAAPKEAQPLLRSALAQAKPHVSSEVYDAIAAAASDAASLSQLMGTAGQAGPISSGASTIGAGGSSTVTDRQLRKKTESICRSLTELCVALTEEGSQRKNNLSISRPQTRGTSVSREEAPSSPPAMKVFTGRRSAGADEPLPSVEFNSPRLTRLDKRATFNFTGMNSTANAPGSRYAASVMGGDDGSGGRMSSLIVSRSRRGATEDPDDQGRKTSLLRTRRAVTAEAEDAEDPEEARRMSYALAPRRVTTISRVSNIDEEPQPGSRAPSRAITEVGRGLRISVPGRESTARRPAAQEPVSASSSHSSRRLLTSALPTPGAYSSRLMTPTTPSVGGRRFLQINRQQQQDDRDDTSNITARMGESRSQRYSIAGQQASTSASQPSNIHRKRNSAIPSFSGTASNVGGYR